MESKLPLTLVTGPLGSGKTTLLIHLAETVPDRMAILMNEFGELDIDSDIIRGRNVEITDLAGGCVCCSLLGEFEAAIGEVVELVKPERIVVETTGIAEPDALTIDVEESLPQVRLDGVVAVLDADAMARYPHVGRTTRMQIEAADLLLLNKVDLVSRDVQARLGDELARLNPMASIVGTDHCRVDPDLLFGLGHSRALRGPRHEHQTEFQSFSYVTDAVLDRDCFERFARRLEETAYRAKGFVVFSDGSYLFHFVAGRWELEPFPAEKTKLVVIGEGLETHKEALLSALEQCRA